MNLLAFLSAALLLCEAGAYTSYMKKIPNGMNVVGNDGNSWGAVGHSSPNKGSALNVFGHDFKANGLKWTEALCRLDSDGDGRTNGEELGDPECIWEEGITPTSQVNITHPGIFNEDFDIVPVNTGSGEASAETLVLPNWLAAHIACMMVAWGFLLPVGALMAISFRHSFADKARWFKLHVYIQIVGVVLNIIGFVIPFVNIETHFKGTHQTFGTVVFALGVAQAAQGFIRPEKSTDGKPTLLRQTWEVCHKSFGRIVIVLAWVNSFLGIQLIRQFYDAAPGNERVMTVCKALLGIQIALVVVLTLASFYRSKPKDSSETEEESDSEVSDESMKKTNHTQGMSSGEMEDVEV